MPLLNPSYHFLTMLTDTISISQGNFAILEYLVEMKHRTASGERFLQKAMTANANNMIPRIKAARQD